MLVLNTTSPQDSPVAPKLRPVTTGPSASASFATRFAMMVSRHFSCLCLGYGKMSLLKMETRNRNSWHRVCSKRKPETLQFPCSKGAIHDPLHPGSARRLDLRRTCVALGHEHGPTAERVLELDPCALVARRNVCGVTGIRQHPGSGAAQQGTRVSAQHQ